MTPATRWPCCSRDTLDAGAPPSMATLPMTPDEVAASYGDPAPGPAATS